MKRFVSSLIIILVCITHNLLANDAKKLIKNNGCLACHSVKLKVLGPSFIDIANKYENGYVRTLILRSEPGSHDIFCFYQPPISISHSLIRACPVLFVHCAYDPSVWKFPRSS